MRGAGLILTAIATALITAPGAAGQDCAGANAQPKPGRLGEASGATLCLVNVERSKAGLLPLKPSGQLKRAAISHSRDMVARQYFDHDSPSGSTIVTRAQAAGYLRGVQTFSLRENLGWGSGRLGTPSGIVKAWMSSPPHRENILRGSLKDAGVGIAVGSPAGGPGGTYTLALGTRRR